MDMTTVRFRVFIDHQLVDDVLVPLGGGVRDLIGELGASQGEIVKQARNRDQDWRVEMLFADGQVLAWGTDPDGMIDPFAVPWDRLASVLHDQIRGA